MHIILGATGHTGSAVLRGLLEEGQPVTAVTQDEAKADTLRKQGARVAVLDVRDTGRLQQLFQTGDSLFLLNPPAAPSTNTDHAERETLRSILSAVEGSGLRHIVAQSTYGAQPGHHIGDLAVLYELEQALARQPIPATIVRAAFLMSNWDNSLPSVREQGLLPHFYPSDFVLPMVSPDDLGRYAASQLLRPSGERAIRHFEGPQRYSSAEAARAFSKGLGRPVGLANIPRERWRETYQQLGFSPEAAESYAGMTAATLETGLPPIGQVLRGTTTLEQYVDQLLKRK